MGSETSREDMAARFCFVHEVYPPNEIEKKNINKRALRGGGTSREDAGASDVLVLPLLVVSMLLLLMAITFKFKMSMLS